MGYDEGLTNSPSPAITGWSVHGSLARANTDATVSLQAVFDEPGSYTVQFSVQAETLDPDEGIKAREIIADIEWSVAGNTIRRQISVTDSASISGNAEAVRVVARDNTVFSELDPTVGSEYQVIITIAKGTRPTTGNPPVLLEGQFSAAIGADSAYIDIPQGIGASSVYVAVGPQTDTTGNKIVYGDVFVDQRGFGTASLMKADALVYQWIPLFPGAVRLKISNYSTVAILATVFWAIDG